LVKIRGEGSEMWSVAEVALREIAPGAKDAVAPLIDLLKSPTLGIREAAIFALGKIGSEAKDAIPALSIIQKDRNRTTANMATQAVGEIQSPVRR
jgi:HEAT repeat protein